MLEWPPRDQLIVHGHCKGFKCKKNDKKTLALKQVTGQAVPGGLLCQWFMVEIHNM